MAMTVDDFAEKVGRRLALVQGGFVPVQREG